MQTKTHTEYTSSDTYVNMHIHSSTNTLLPLLPNWYNGLYLHSSLDKRVVPLERWIVANWMRIHHEARALCEKWGMFLFWSACFHSFNDSLVFAFFFLGVAFAAESCLRSQLFLQLMDKLFNYNRAPPHVWDSSSSFLLPHVGLARPRVVHLS